MDSSTATVDPENDYKIEPPEQPQGASASSSDDYSIEVPQQPANPNIDMSQVAGATPGTPNPAQVGAGGLRAASADRPVDKLTGYQAVTHQADFPTSSAGEQRDDALLDQVFTGGNKEHPVEGYLRQQDPILASAPVGLYETGAGLKDVASGIANKDKNAAARGGTRAISGAMEAGTIPFGAAVAKAPVQMAVGYLQGLATGEGAKFVAKKMGMSPDEQEFAHTVGFFMPMAYHTAAQSLGLKAGIGQGTKTVTDPVTGQTREVPVTTAGVTGNGFGVGVGKGEDGSYFGAARVGPFSVRGQTGGRPQEAPNGPTIEGQQPPPTIAGQISPQAQDPTANLGTPLPPEATPAEVIAQQQSQHVEGFAQRADASGDAAHAIATGQPPPAPPQTPVPAGMEHGLLSQPTVDHAISGVLALPPEQRPSAIQETIQNLSKWFEKVKTAIMPNGRVQVIDSPKAAVKTAIDTVNDAMEAHDQKQEDAKDALEETQKENDKAEGEYQIEHPKPIPQTAAVKLARKKLAALPEDAAPEDMHAALGNLAITSQTRDSLVNEAISNRPAPKPKPAQEQPTLEGTGPKPEVLQAQADSVKGGDEPFMRVPHGNEFRPKNVDELSRTAVTGAKDKNFNGVYYHSNDITGDLIRKAARDKKDPQAALDALKADWKGRKENPQEPVKSDIAESEPQSPTVTNGDEATSSPTLEGLEGKRVHLNLSDESRVPAKHKLVELKDLVPSHRPTANYEPRQDYPQEIQERRYESSPDEQLKVQAHAQDIKPEMMSNTDTSGVTGPPIVTSRDITIGGRLIKKGTVIGGNSRVMTADLLYNVTNGDSEKYKSHIESHHRDFGFESEPTRGFHQPVHVVEIEPPSSIEELTRLGSLVNTPPTQELNVFDRAVSLSKRLSPETLQGISDLVRDASTVDHAATFNAVLTNEKSGRAIVRMLEGDGIITNTNRPGWIDPATGILNSDARPRLANAMLATLLNSRDLMEQTPAILKQRLLGSLGSISSIIAREDDWNIAPAMRAAAKEFGRLTRSHDSVASGLTQVGMFEQRGPVVTALTKMFDSPVNDMRKAFGLFAADAAMDVEEQGILAGLIRKPEAWDAFNVAFGTTLTKEQFDGEMKGLEAGTEQAVTETTPTPTETTQQPKAVTVGDQVEYTTNKGKQRSGTVAWTDGKKVRIKDGASQVTKSIEEVKAFTEPSKPEVNRTLISTLRDAIQGGGGPSDYNALKKIVQEFDGKEPDQLRMKTAQEAYETAMVDHASRIVEKSGAKPAFDKLVQLYENQPNLSIRTSSSVTNQAYSTPAPLAFIADRLAGARKGASVYEPTAGNGMLMIGVGSSTPARSGVWVNEIDQQRAENLSELGFSPTRNDASTWAPSAHFDSVVANPPFDSLKAPVKIDGYSIVKMEHLIAAKALSVMKDMGKATIILGASRESGEMPANQRPFFNWLYSRYNVVSDFELEGQMYSRQGASWPVRVIAIDGRVRSAKVAPLPETIARLGTWGEVYERASQVLGSNLEGGRGANGVPDRAVAGAEATGSGAVPGRADVEAVGTDREEPEASLEGYGRGSNSNAGPVQHSGGVPAPRVGSADITVRSDGDVAESDRLAEGEPAEVGKRGAPPESDGLSSDALASEETQFQVPYRAASAKKDVGILAPRALKSAMESAIRAVQDRHGDLDDYVTNELGYSSTEDMHRAFMGIQVDAIAQALDQISRGKALILADETGVGKGRVAAAVIRWSELHGLIPIFVTYNDTLFSAMYGDLHDIGSSGTINPLLFNAGSSITDPVTGAKIFSNNGSMRATLERLAESRELPEGRNAIFATYSQINTPNRQQQAMRALAHKSVFILDESHNAGGSSNTGEFMISVLPEAKGAMYLSATWAKRPDNMPLYAAKTDMAIALPDNEKLADAIQRGGVPLQAVLSNQTAQSGQLVRRERSFAGITFETLVDEAHAMEHERTADSVTEVLRAIVDADKLFHQKDFARIVKEAKKEGRGAQAGGNQASKTVQHMEFSSIVHNLVRQLLLSLKADDAGTKAIETIEAGKKPLIAFENTMGSFLDAYADGNNLRNGDSLENFNYGTVLKRALDRTRYYNETDEQGNKTRVEVHVEELSPETQALYRAAEGLIRKLTIDLPASPIDWIRHRIEEAGYQVAEITGRTRAVDYSGDVPRLTEVPADERKDRVRTGTRFNNGGGDAILLNAAGSTGISLHASEKFKDQKQRKMFVLQPAGDVNIFMQMLGRIKRTGQVRLPEYAMLAAALPAEVRPAINLTKKMKSLNANTTSNTKSAMTLDAPDLMNKYGDEVVAQYLQDNPEMAEALGLEPGDEEDKTAQEDLARKATGRSALLPVAKQREFIDAIVEAYSDYIGYLDETGQNDLEPKTYDLDARETHRQTIYRGVDSSSPFGADADYVEYSIKRQGKPYTPEEVEAKIKAGIGDAPNTTMAARAMRDQLEAPFQSYLKGLTAQHALDRAQAVRGAGVSLLANFRVGTGLHIEINGEDYNAIVTNIEPAKNPTGNPYAPSSLKFTLALNGALREIRIPGSKITKITTSNLGYGHNATPKQLFFNIQQGARTKAKIITGNLLGAYGSLAKGINGRIITFTTAEGKTELGIQMPHKFDPAKHVSDVYAMRTAEGAQKFLNLAPHSEGVTLSSPGGDVWVMRKPGHTNLEISSKPSKSAGGKFFLDPDLRSMVLNHEFVTKGGRMVATIEQGKEARALSIVMRKAALYPTVSMQNQARELEAGMQTPPEPKRDTSVVFSSLGSYQAEQALNAAGRFASKAAVGTFGDLVKAAGIVGKTAKAAGYEIAAALYPAILADPQARDAMGRALGKPALEQFKAGQLLEGVSKMFDGMSAEDQVEFVDRYQTGKDQPSPDLEAAADLIRGVLENQRRQENEAVNLGRPKSKRIALSDKANYFPNRYETAPGKEALIPEEEHIASIAPKMAKRPLAGPKTFLKQQKYTLKEAVANGGVPLGNPVVMVLRRVQEGAKFVAAHQYMHNLKEGGFLSFVRGSKPTPEGYVDIQDRIAKVWRPIEEAPDELGNSQTHFVESGRWVGEKNALRLLNNYLSRDLIRATAIGSTFCDIKNISTGLKLGLSPFHYGVIGFWSMATRLAQGLDEFYNQGVRDFDPTKMSAGIKKAATFVYAPIAGVREGGQMLQYLKNPDGFLSTPLGQKFAESYPDFPHLLDLVYAGGLRMGMTNEYRVSMGDGFWHEIAVGHLGKATLKAFPWLAQLVTKPLFEHVIPRTKLVFAVQMLSQKLEQYSDAISTGQITEEKLARDVVASLENRFGEFNYDSLYWNNTLRTAMQVTFRAASWKLGTWRGLAQAGKETFSSQAFDDRIYDRIDEEGRKGQTVRDWTRKLPQLGMNAGGLIAAGMMMAVMGTLITRLASHKWPWEWAEEDHEKNGMNQAAAMAFEAAHPRTGVVNPKSGIPMRFSFPTDLRDYEHALVNPVGYARGSLSDPVVNMLDTLQNSDAFHNYVFNPADPEWLKFKQGILYNLKGDFTPISVSNYRDQYGPQDGATRVEKMSGVLGGSPPAWDRSKAFNRAHDLHDARDPHKPLTPEEQAEHQFLGQEKPSRMKVLRAARDRNLDALDKYVKYALTYSEAKEIFDRYANSNERETLRPILERKRMAAILSARKRGNGTVVVVPPL